MRPEPRGIGRSAPLSPGATLHDMAADVAAAMQALGIAPAMAVAHAAGNWVARMLAHDAPDLVRGVAMLAAVTGVSTPPDITHAISSSFDPTLPETERLRYLNPPISRQGHDARVWLAGWHAEVARVQRAAPCRDEGHGMAARGGTPSAALHGSRAGRDRAAALRGGGALALGPQRERIVIPQAGHALLPEQPEAVAQALIAFARTLWP